MSEDTIANCIHIISLKPNFLLMDKEKYSNFEKKNNIQRFNYIQNV